MYSANGAKLALSGGGKKKRGKAKKVSKKKSKRTKIKVKIKGSPVGVHNAIQKLAGNGPSGGGNSHMTVKVEDGDKDGE